MKKILPFVLVICMLFALAGCGNSATQQPTVDPSDHQQGNDAAQAAQKIDVDLTQLSGTMVYSEVYNMMTAPDDYIGKTVKMRGNFGAFQDQTTNKLYFACLIADATACCSQGIEFVLTDDYSFPEDYPEINSIITVSGTFNTYEENGYTYCQLINAKMEV